MHALRAGWLALLLPLAGCMGEGTGQGWPMLPGATGGGEDPAALTRASLFGGRVVVAGPKGYCIEPQSLRRGGNRAFVLIASCESLTGTRDGAGEPAVLTVSVLPRQAGAAPPDSQSLAALAEGARILQSADNEGLSYVQLSAGGDRLLPQGDPRHWRGSMVVNGHLVALAVYGPKGSTVAGALGANLLRAQAETIRSLSPGAD